MLPFGICDPQRNLCGYIDMSAGSTGKDISMSK